MTKKTPSMRQTSASQTQWLWLSPKNKMPQPMPARATMKFTVEKKTGPRKRISSTKR